MKKDIVATRFNHAATRFGYTELFLPVGPENANAGVPEQFENNAEQRRERKWPRAKESTARLHEKSLEEISEPCCSA